MLIETTIGIEGLMRIRTACGGEIIQLVPGKFSFLGTHVKESAFEAVLNLAELGKICCLQFVFDIHIASLLSLCYSFYHNIRLGEQPITDIYKIF